MEMGFPFRVEVDVIWLLQEANFRCTHLVSLNSRLLSLLHNVMLGSLGQAGDHYYKPLCVGRNIFLTDTSMHSFMREGSVQ